MVFFKELIAEFERLRFFKFEFCSKTRHLAAQVLEYFSSVAGEYFFDVRDIVLIGVGLDQTAATTLETLDMILEAEAPGFALQIFRRDLEAAGAKGVDLADEFDDGFCDGGVGVWAKVFGTVAEVVTGNEYAREKFVCNGNPRIRFVVLEQHIIARTVLFDECIF